MKTIGADKARRRVTDHAIVRYIERVQGIDLSFVAQEILSDPTVYNALKMGAEFLTKDGIEYRMKEGRIITIINHEMDDMECAA